MTTRNEKDKKVFAFVFTNAMRDATLQGAYHGEKTWLQNIEKFPKTEKTLTRLAKKVIGNKFKRQEKYDMQFLDAVKTVCNEINENRNDNPEFTFGNGQKLINIMMKYFYISTYGKDKSGFRFCHCPMDRQLLECVWDKRRNLTNTKLSYSREKWFDGWSKLELDNGNLPKRYVDFQDAVRELAGMDNLKALDYDYVNWNRLAAGGLEGRGSQADSRMADRGYILKHCLDRSENA